MSVQVRGVYILPPQMLSEKNGNTVAKTKTVAIVAPQRSNSLDYLNFEEKRQLIASSLSLSDFLQVNNTKDIKDNSVTTVLVGKIFYYLFVILFVTCQFVYLIRSGKNEF